MQKQKGMALFCAFVTAGLGTFFYKRFLAGGSELFVSMFLFMAVTVAGLSFFKKTRPQMQAFALKAMPWAAVVFAASYILSFRAFFLAEFQAFGVLVLEAACLSRLAVSVRGKADMLSAVAAGVAGAVVAGVMPPVGYAVFVIAALAGKGSPAGRSLQEKWNDVALPLFVFVGAFVLFIAANHAGGCPAAVAESIVLVMTGALIIASGASGARLMLMTAVMVVFGSYVFSAENPQSVFNHSSSARIEQPLSR